MLNIERVQHDAFDPQLREPAHGVAGLALQSVAPALHLVFAAADLAAPPAGNDHADVQQVEHGAALLAVHRAEVLVGGLRQFLQALPAVGLLLGALGQGLQLCAASEQPALVLLELRHGGLEHVRVDAGREGGCVRFEKAGGHKLRDADSNHLGDIDVLVVDDARRELVCVEVKELASALAPHQLANELRETFGTGGTRRSHAEKHVRRVDWIKENLAPVLAEVGADTTGNWTASGVIVTSGEVLTPLIAHTPLPVRSYRRVQAALAAGAPF